MRKKFFSDQEKLLNENSLLNAFRLKTNLKFEAEGQEFENI